MNQLMLCTTLAIGLLTLPAAAETIYVDGVNGNDDWDGLCETWDGGTCGPKETIGAGIGVADDGDEVIIADATYSGPDNRNLSYAGKAITVRSAHGPENCIIDLMGYGDPAFLFTQGEGPDSTLDGVMLKNCYGC
ncbi:MAG: hypothetical protein SYC29_11800 [Planctomycetota bacterium]|nr:hypothetical protein [Planctomycetota bacterium]